jgi:hypothetical protein
MVSMDMDESVKEPKVRNAWRFLIISAITLCIILTIINTRFRSNISNSLSLSYYYRIFLTLIALYFIIVWAIISIRHYTYLFVTGKEINFSNIIDIYIGFILFFGALYNNIYLVKQSLFTIKDNIYHIDQLVPFTYDFKRILDFLIYSACNMFLVNYHRIYSNSMLISVINVLEVIVGIFLISLFISTFVQKTCK